MAAASASSPEIFIPYLPEIALPRAKTSDLMLIECAQIACADCRAVLVEIQDAVHSGVDTDGWWRDQFKMMRENIHSGCHVHVSK